MINTNIFSEITKGEISVIEQLIHLLTDPNIQSNFSMNISTNVKQFFPIQITLSLTLMILWNSRIFYEGK